MERCPSIKVSESAPLLISDQYIPALLQLYIECIGCGSLNIYFPARVRMKYYECTLPSPECSMLAMS